MTAEKLREVHRKQPFHPFVMHLADGRSVRVDHPEMILISPMGRTAVVFQRDDSCNFVDLPLVTDLELKANGKSKARST